MNAHTKRTTNPDRHSRESGNPAPLASIAKQSTSASVRLSDKQTFQTLNGLWTGKKAPYSRAVVIRNTNFTSEGILDLSNVAELDVETKQLASRELLPGDIIVERSGGGPKQAVGRVCYFDASGPQPYSFSNFTSVIRVLDTERWLPRYVHYFLMHLYQSGFTEGLQHATTGIRNLDFSTYLDVEVPRLPKREQEKIAAVLWKVQQSIQTQDSILRATLELKTSTMQHLFTRGLHDESLQDTENGTMPISWIPTKFSELREFLQYGTSSKCGYQRQGRPVIRIPNIANGVVDTTDIKWADLTAKEVSRYELIGGDILFIRTNGVIDRVGSCAVFHDEPSEALFASYLIRARPNARLHPEFFQYYSMTTQGRAQLAGVASSAADGKFNINTKAIDVVMVPLPDIDEQRDIANVLGAIDKKIAYHQRKRIVLSDLFQTLLQQLMTSQVRVTDMDIDTGCVTALSTQGATA